MYYSVVFDNQYHAFWAQLNGYPAWNPKEDEQLCAKGTARGVSDIQVWYLVLDFAQEAESYTL